MSDLHPVLCPRCKGQTHKFGKDPFHRQQRYRCKNPQCRHQFVPGRTRKPKKYPSHTCPKCGSNMSIFKHLSDGYRLRCNRYTAKGKRNCSHKINVPLPGKIFHTATDPVQAIDTDHLAIPFSWNKMHFSKDTLALVAYFSVIHAIPAAQIAQIMKQIYRVDISHDTITRWNHKIALNLHQNLGPLQVPFSPHKRLFTDETQFRVRGQKRWVWAGKDSKFDSLQSWFLSPRRSTDYARSTLNIAFTNSPSLWKANVVTDGLHSYPSALDDLGYETEKRHIRYVGWNYAPLTKVNNNRLERQWSDFKTAAGPYRGFKSDLGLWCFITARTYRHNYFLPNQRLDGKTPAQAVGKKLPYCHDLWKLMTKFL